MDQDVLREIAARREWRRHEERIRSERRRAQLRRALGLLFAVIVLAGMAGGVLASGTIGTGSGPGPGSQLGTPMAHAGAAAIPLPAGLPRRLAPQPTRYGERPAPPSEQVLVTFRRPPVSGLLWNIDTGQMLWSRRPTARVPIASLTKMMTALLVDERTSPGEPVRITRAAVNYQGSAIGVLKLGMRIGVETLMYGLLLPSGNDAAIALAQHVSGTLTAFVALMNRTAVQMHLGCTQFARPDGFQDKGNHSCAVDLAALTRAILGRPRLARIVSTPMAVRPFPQKGGKLYLYNNNPLLLARYPGTIGVKTGYTQAAGHCLVAAAQRGSVRLGVVLLNAPGPPGTGPEATRLLDAGFRAMGV